MAHRAYRRKAVVDAGPLVALYDTDDEYHNACVDWYDQALRERTLLLVPMPVITEVCQLLSRADRASSPEDSLLEAEFLKLLGADSSFRLCSPSRKALSRMATLVQQYRGFPLGGADASVVAAAEQHGTATIATIDRRHFLSVLSINGLPFTLVPDL